MSSGDKSFLSCSQSFKSSANSFGELVWHRCDQELSYPGACFGYQPARCQSQMPTLWEASPGLSWRRL